MSVMQFLKKALIFATSSLTALVPGLPAAQGAIIWRLSDYPTGGPVFSRVVADPLIGEPDLLVPTCRALAPGTPEQAASGFVGIGMAIEGSPNDISNDISVRLPQCCPLLIGTDSDAKITFGAALALATREIGEDSIESAREVERLIGQCGDETALRSYQIARGEDSLGQLIAQEGPDGPTTVSVTPPPSTTGGGGIPSGN